MSQIHSTAIIDAGARLGDDVEVGPYSIVGPKAVIGDGTRLMSHVVVDGWTTIGSQCTVFPFACIGTETQDMKYRGARTFVEIGDKTTVREYVTVNSGTEEGDVTRIGSGCLIMACSHVAHACRIGNEVVMANAANLAGHIVVEDRAVIGGLTGVHQFVRVGAMCIVGGMSRISQDCPPYMMVAGSPPEVKSLNSVGLRRANVNGQARRLLKEAFRILFRDGLSTSQALVRIEADLEKCPEIEHLVEFVKSSERGICK